MGSQVGFSLREPRLRSRGRTYAHPADSELLNRQTIVFAETDPLQSKASELEQSRIAIVNSVPLNRTKRNNRLSAEVNQDAQTVPVPGELWLRQSKGSSRSTGSAPAQFSPDGFRQSLAR
jgi:hypothetical protein